MSSSPAIRPTSSSNPLLSPPSAPAKTLHPNGLSGAGPSPAGPTTLGHLPRKPGPTAKRVAPLVGLLAHPASPNSLGFAKSAVGSFGRVGAAEPASPVDKTKRLGAAPLGSPTRARKLGSFNSLAVQLGGSGGGRVRTEEVAAAPERSIHRLRHQWVFWVLSRAPSRKMSEEEFEKAMRRLGSCDSVETFYSLYLHIKRPSEQPVITDLHLFADPIRPVWEDPANVGGGKWTVRLRKGLADRLWEALVLSVIGGSLEKLVAGGGQEICGAVLSIRKDEDILAVWHRSGSAEAGADGKMAKQVKLSIQTVLQLPLTCNLVYKLNADSLASGTTNGHKFTHHDQLNSATNPDHPHHPNHHHHHHPHHPQRHQAAKLNHHQIGASTPRVSLGVGNHPGGLLNSSGNQRTSHLPTGGINNSSTSPVAATTAGLPGGGGGNRKREGMIE